MSISSAQFENNVIMRIPLSLTCSATEKWKKMNKSPYGSKVKIYRTQRGRSFLCLWMTNGGKIFSEHYHHLLYV